MKYLLPILGLLLSGCQVYQRTQCRHEVLSQAASCMEAYGHENVQVWLLKDQFGQLHAQVKVRTPDGVRWLDNDHRYYELTQQPRKWFKPVRRLRQHELGVIIATTTKEKE